MHPILFQRGWLTVYSYGFFVALGVLVATLWLSRKVEKQGESPQFVVDLVILSVVAGVVGARLTYILLYDPVYYLTHPLQIFMLWEGGLAFYGALLFGLLASYLYLRRIRMPYLAFLDLVAPAIALGYAFARIGCFLNGCCYGIPTSLPWGVVFPVVDGLPRHPTQLYSMFAALLIFVVLELFSRQSRRRGQVFSLFLVMYGVSRGVIELFRENPTVWGGSIASLTAFAVAVAGGVLYFYLARRGLPVGLVGGGKAPLSPSSERKG